MKPLNFEVQEKPGDTVDKLIKRFLKKTSKSRIVQQTMERMSFQSKSSINRRKKTRKKFIKRKIQESFENYLKSEN